MGLWGTSRGRPLTKKPLASTGPAPEMAEVNPTPAASEAQAALDRAPDMPAWSETMMGQQISRLFPNLIEHCIGGAGRIGMRFASPQAIVRVDGWSWNVDSKYAFERLLVTDSKGVVIGAGTTFVERQDVMDAHPSVVTALVSGYQVFVKDGHDVVSIYGIDEASKSAGKISDRPL